MKTEICTNPKDPYLHKLIMEDMMISWKTKLSDDTWVYGDYDRPDYLNPWTRLKMHCIDNSLNVVDVQLYMFGTEQKSFVTDPQGIDGIVCIRGLGKEQSMTGDHSQSFQILTVLHLNENCKNITAYKYTWPYTPFEPEVSIREVNHNNVYQMIFRHDSEKIKQPQILQYLNQPAL